jgi:hypothetical protein
MLIKVSGSRLRCKYSFPCVSEGGIIVGEDRCFLPAGHDGPHRGLHGATGNNTEDVLKEFDPATGRKYY